MMPKVEIERCVMRGRSAQEEIEPVCSFVGEKSRCQVMLPHTHGFIVDLPSEDARKSRKKAFSNSMTGSVCIKSFHMLYITQHHPWQRSR